MSSITIYGFVALFMFAFAEHHGDLNGHSHRFLAAFSVAALWPIAVPMFLGVLAAELYNRALGDTDQ